MCMFYIFVGFFFLVFFCMFYQNYVLDNYTTYRHKCTQLDGLPKAQPRINYLSIVIIL